MNKTKSQWARSARMENQCANRMRRLGWYEYEKMCRWFARNNIKAAREVAARERTQ